MITTIILLIITIWLLISAWLTAWSLAEDLGFDFSTPRDWIILICPLLVAPIIHFVIYPFERWRSQRKK